MSSRPQHTERTGPFPAPPHLTAEQAAFAEVLGHLLAEVWRKQGQEAADSSCATARPTPQSVEPAG